jgi:choline monooxygenase
MRMIEPVAELLRNASRPFTDAVAMPPSVYTSEVFLAR